MTRTVEALLTQASAAQTTSAERNLTAAVVSPTSFVFSPTSDGTSTPTATHAPSPTPAPTLLPVVATQTVSVIYSQYTELEDDISTRYFASEDDSILFAQRYRTELPDGRVTLGEHLCQWEPETGIRYLASSPFNLLPPYENDLGHGSSYFTNLIVSSDQKDLIASINYVPSCGWNRCSFGSDNGEIWKIDLQSGNTTVVLDANQLNEFRQSERSSALPFQVTTVPGTDFILFNTHRSWNVGFGFTTDLHLLDIRTLSHEVLLPPGEGGQFTVSPNGRYIAITTPDSIKLFDLNERTIVKLLDYFWSCTACDYVYYASPVWSEDSLSLAVEIPVLDSNDYYSMAEMHLVVLNLDGTSTEHRFAVGSFARTKAIFSPDLSFALYQDESSRVVHVIDLVTGEIVKDFTLLRIIDMPDQWLDASSFVYSENQIGSAPLSFVVSVEEGNLELYEDNSILPSESDLSCTPPTP